MATRVFELARKIGVTSKTVLEKCRAEGLEIKNHMSTVSAGLEATIQEWFSDMGGGTAVEVADHVDLKKARAEARKRRRKSVPKEAEAEAAPVAEVEVAPAAPVEAPAPAAEAEPEAAPVAAEAPGEHEKEQAPVVAEAQVAPEEEVAAEPVADEREEPAEEEQPEPQQEPEPIRPAGPQVVPRPAKLKGPRVVRVDRPEAASLRRGPRPPTMSQGPSVGDISGAAKTGRAPPTAEEGAGRKKTKRRSPRRRGGRSADSGEGVREWRDQDLFERSQRLAAASGGGLRRRRPSVPQKGTRLIAGQKTGQVAISEPITVRGLSETTGIKSSDIIRKMMEAGQLATVNQVIDRESAEAVALEFGIELVVHIARSAEDELLERLGTRQKGDIVPRAPVVTFLGHVDHGKTSLLDRIRKTAVASGEAGGITQHTGAYRYDEDEKHVVFLDTPGHEAFTSMRARGANMTDVVVLVVAADDGVMPQTVEAIDHARAAEVPIVVAVNKIDLPNANVQRALGQLGEYGLHPQQWGGDVEVIETSAETGAGIDTLVETLSLEAELLELVAEPTAPATGYVVEAEMDPGRGAVARLLVLDGTLRVGDILLAGGGYGRVRQMIDSLGRAVEQAGPATPVEVSGLDGVPEAGDRFYIVKTLDEARSVAADRRRAARAQALASAPRKTLESLLGQMEAGEINQLAIVLKADVQGSVEALVDSLDRLGTDEVRVNILHAAVGAVSTGDVALAEASNAIIIGFNVVADATARQHAEAGGVDIRLYRVIYDVIDDIRAALEEGLAPEVREETLGRAEVRQIFKVSRVGTVAGCIVTDGLVDRSAKVRITRGGIVTQDNRALESLKRFKDDVREVRAGMECGLKVAGYDDIKEGDVLEFYQQVEVARKLGE